MLFIILIGIVIAAFIIIRNYGKDAVPFEATTIATLQEKLPYRKKDYLLSIAERNFYETLRHVADNNNCIVFAKVRLEDLIWLPRNTQNLLKWRGYVRSRHI